MELADVTILARKDIKAKRKEIFDIQDKKCLICGESVAFEDTALDHQHKLFKDQPLLEDDAGLIRGVLCKQCNSWEGKIVKSFRRMGLHKKDRSMYELLYYLAKYLQMEKYPLIHPSEIEKPKKLSKRNYNILHKKYIQSKRKKKFPEFPKSGKLTKKLKVLFEEFEVSPYNG